MWDVFPPKAQSTMLGFMISWTERYSTRKRRQRCLPLTFHTFIKNLGVSTLYSSLSVDPSILDSCMRCNKPLQYQCQKAIRQAHHAFLTSALHHFLVSAYVSKIVTECQAPERVSSTIKLLSNSLSTSFKH